jgi:DNA-binding transcriptional ArsR family regulator
LPGKKKKSKAAAAPAATLPEKQSLTLSSLEQVKVLADPLRIRILESLMIERTTKQVADLLGERPTKLYHHVDALERVGLIRPTRTRQNRGTIEKYYQAVARSFRSNSRLFETPSRKKNTRAVSKLLTTIFDNTSEELRDLLASGTSPGDVQKEGVLSYVEIRASSETMRSIRGKLASLVKHDRDSNREPDEEMRRFRLTVAFFPIDRNSKKKSTS